MGRFAVVIPPASDIAVEDLVERFFALPPWAVPAEEES